MGYHTTATFRQIHSRQDYEADARDEVLRGHHLDLHEDSIPRILHHIDCFARQCRGNEFITEVSLHPYAYYGQGDDVWEKVGQAVGNLQSLKSLFITTRDRTNGATPGWGEGELTCILSRVRQDVRVELTNTYRWSIGEVKAFARAIHGHPTITSFTSCYNLRSEAMDSLYSALATLPALGLITLSNSRRQVQLDDESFLSHHEKLTEVLRAPSLRSVCFDRFHFTSAFCQAAANALMEGTMITKLVFSECSFSAPEGAGIIANGLARNTSVSCIKVVCHRDKALCSALAMALPSNSTLQELSYEVYETGAHVDWSPIFFALGNNTGLKTLSVDHCCGLALDESLCAAMQNGLGTNATLEHLQFNGIRLCDDAADLWCRTFSFLHTNRALKSLAVEVLYPVTESCISTCVGIAAMLRENASLESLSVQNSYSINIKAKDYFELVAALQHNTTLKSFKLNDHSTIRLNEDEDKQIASLLKKNYALETLPDFDLEDRAGDVGAILRLNGAGRRYLVQDGCSISKGVEVLSKVNDDINCVFVHLLENPTLCDRSAVEMVSAGESNIRSTSLTASSGAGKNCE
jgi:hypothetical protein